ncbi:MAG: hypothetical protein ABL308_09970 [Oceanicaulis sp.]
MLAAAFVSLALQTAPEPEAAYAAWRSGDLTEAGRAALDALTALEAEACSIGPDGARLAYMVGTAAAFGLIEDEPYSYWFWAARRIDAAAGGLNHARLEAAERMSGEPGRDPSLDSRFARSRYLARGLKADACATSSGALADPAPGDGPAAYLAVLVEPGRAGEVRRAETLLAYPEREGEALAGAIRGAFLPLTGHGERFITFDPCAAFFDEVMNRVEICRD